MSSANLLPPYPPPVRPSNPYAINPAVISVIGALGSIFLVLSYYQLLLKYCSCFERLVHRGAGRHGNEANVSDEEVLNPQGVGASIIAKIPILKYNTEDFAAGAECSVCLTEFSEGELVRVLPNCRHAFHISCIGMWLNSHHNCPLCRADILMGLLHLLSASPSEEQGTADGAHAPTGGEVETRSSHSNFAFSGAASTHDTANAGERHLWRSLSSAGQRSALTRSWSINASLTDVPPEGASGSQWYRRFRWSKRVSSPSHEDMHSRLLQSGAIDYTSGHPNEVAIDLDGHANIGNGISKLHVSNGGEGASASATNKDILLRNFSMKE